MPTLRTPAQLARDIGVTTASVLRWARDGRIPCHRVGARIWFDLAAVNAATLRVATVVKVAEESPVPQVSERYLEIINGRQARHGGRSAGTKKRAARGV